MTKRPDVDGPLTSLRQGTTDARAVQQYYDDWADGYDATLQAWQYRAPEDSADLLSPHLSSGTRVLDVGCGTGQLGHALCQRAALALDGMDISAASLKQAQKRGIYDLLMQHNLQETPLPVDDNIYDIAATVGVLTYIADAEALLRDLCRIVRGGGVIAFTQRTDLWEERGFDEMIERMEAEGAWQRDKVSAPMPYLPGNEEFADEIRVIHTLCRVTP
ncbi:MAG: methyltransferase domain-containing protein [Rhodobacteraceae bacterium]|nr:methyltransferase domain-containing protein [Paracoccaceae bacterium]